MANYVKLPDGSFFPAVEGEDYATTMRAAYAKYPEAFGGEKTKPTVDTTGFKAAASASTSRLQGEAALTAAKIGLMDPAKAEEYYKAKEEEAKARFTPTEEGWTEAPLLKLRETFGGSVPYMVAPAAAGIAALAAPVSAPAAAALGAAGAFGASAAQFTGSNIARQMDTGKTLEETSGAAAFGAAIPQALFDTAAMALMPGIGKLFGSVGTKLTTEQAKAIASQTLSKTVADYAAKTGAAMGREGFTETAQQLLERLQAGLDIADPEARKEYIDSFIGGAALAGVGAPIGRGFERGAAKRQAAAAQREEADVAAKAEAQRAEAEKQRLAVERTKPEYLADLQTRYDALVAKDRELEAKTKLKPEGTDPASKQLAAEQRKAAVQELQDFRASPEYEALVQERVQAAPLLKKIEAERKATEAVFGKEPTYEAEDMSDIGQMTALQKQIDDLKKQQKGLSPAEQQPLQNRINALEDSMDQLGRPDETVYRAAKKQLTDMLDKFDEDIVKATSTAEEQKIMERQQRLAEALAKLQRMEPFVKTVTKMPSLSDLRDQMDEAKAKGDPEAIRRLVPKLAEAERQSTLPFDTDPYEVLADSRMALNALNAKLRQATEPDERAELEQAIAKVQQKIDKITSVPSGPALADEIANAREEAARRRETVAKETEALFRIGEKGLSDFEVGLRKARLDEAREVIRQASKPAAERVKVAKPYRVQPGGKLNLATRASMLVRENEQDWASFDKEVKENAFRVEDREKLRDQLKSKLKDLEAEYNEFSKYGPSKALELVRTETAAIENALAQVERKLKIGRDKAVREADAATQIVEASDARVAELIDRLLPFATGEKPLTAEQAQEAQARKEKQELGQASLFDVEAQKQLAAGVPTPEGEQRIESKEVSPGVRMERTATQDGGTRTRIYRNGELSQDLTRYRYETTIDDEPQIIRVERNNITEQTEAYPEQAGRAIGSGYKISAFVEQGVSVLDALRRVVPDMGSTVSLLRPSLPVATSKTVPAPAKPAAQKVSQAPIEQAADLVERAKELRARLKEYSAAIQKAGRPSDPEKLARLNDLKDLRDSTLSELDAVQKQYAGLTARQTPAYQPTAAEPGTADLFGGLEKARAATNRLQAELDTLYAERDDIRASMERRGQVGATPQLQALAEQYSKETPRLREVEAQIEKTEAQLEEASGRKSARFDEFAQARERERVVEGDDIGRMEQELQSLRTAQPYMEQLGQPGAAEQIAKAITDLEAQIKQAKAAAPSVARERTRTLPGFERRAGLKPVDPAKLQDAKQRLVSLRNIEETLRKARASADVDPTRYLRQVAIQKTEEYEAYLVQSNDPIVKTWPPQKAAVLSKKYPKRIEPTARDVERIEELRKQISYFSNIMKGVDRKSVEANLQDNLKQQEKVRAEIADLESRQRAYEQQEAVRTGAAPGTAEAERLIAGEGYRTPSGQIRTAPKKLASWGITEITKKTPPVVAPAKVTATAAMLTQYQKETEAATQAAAAEKETLERKLARTTKNIERLSNALAQVYPAAVEKTTEEQITNLLAPGFTPEQRASLRDMAQVYAGLKNSVVGNTTADVIARLEAEKERLLQEKGRFTAVRGEDEKKAQSTNQERITDLNNLINDLKRQPKTLDPWVAALTSITKELDAKAVTAAQEADFAQKSYDAADRARAQAQAKIDALKKQPMSSTFAAQMSNLEYQYDQQVARLQEAVVDLSDKNAAYRLARLEQLNFLKAYGQDLKNIIATEADTVQSLRPQIEEQAKTNKELESKLKKANQMLAAKRVEEREAAAAKVPRATDVIELSAKEQRVLRKYQEGAGIEGVRYERDTTNKLAIKTRKAIRDELTLREAELDKAKLPAQNAERRLAAALQERTAAVAKGDAKEIDIAEQRVKNAQRDVEIAQKENSEIIQKLTAQVQQLEADYESIYRLGERVKTGVGGVQVSADVTAGLSPFEQARQTYGIPTEPVEPGTRLGRRRVGPVARVGTQPPGQMLSGTQESREAISKGNRPMQTGAVRLTASDLNRADANAVSLTVLKQQLDAATGDRKTQLQAAFDAATNGMTDEQVKAKIKEGNDLIKLPGAAAIVAARERVRAADAAFAKAEADLLEAKTPAAKELMRDARDMARQEQQRAEYALEAAKANVASGVEFTASAQTQAEQAIEDAVERVQRQQRKGSEEQKAIGEAEGDVAVVYNTSASRTESNPAVVEAIMDGRFTEAVERLAVDSTNPLVRETAEDVRRLLLRTKVQIVPDLMHEGKSVPALYSPSTNTVMFRPDAITDEDVVHEAVHAVTLQVLRKPDTDLTPQQRNAKREIIAIYNQLAKRSDLTTEYGISDVEEFVSEMQSNAEFRAAVDKQPWYKRFWHAITRLWSNKPIEKISDQTSALIKQIYAPSTIVTEGKQQVASIFRRETPPASAIVGYEPGKLATLKGNLFGLSGRVQYIDRLAAADEAIVKGEGAGKLSSTEAFNAQYFMRMGDKVTQAAGQFITDGPTRIVADKVGNTTEYRYEATSGANLINMSTDIEQAAKAGGMSPQEAETMLTVLIAGQRANAVANGWERLQAKDPAGAKAEYNNYVNKMNANPKVKAAMEAAMQEYKTYNEGLLNFAAQSGYLSKDEVRRLNKMPYVPFYRVEDGNVKLFVLGERPITIGNIKDSPDLKQFLGDEQKIQPILTSAVQNTFMLTRMAMHNKATMETSNALYKAGFASKMGKGAGPANPNTVRYKIDGDDHFAVIDSDTFGIPAELIVRGMEGIKTTVHDIVKMMGIPADVLRKFITRGPAYIVRQLVREPVNAFIVSGVDGVPIANALRELAKMRAGRSPAELALMRGLVVSSNIYTGGEADMQKFLGDVAAGRSGWDKFLGKLDTMALQADAATRAVIYQDGLKKGLSEAKAQFRAMESANFGRRGLSPSMQVMGTLIPFFNAQIQGLDVLYRSLRGKMPFSQQLEIQRKIVARGSLLFAGAMAYAFMMQDDDDYKKAKPEERYSNFFVNIPGVRDPLRLPVPFEVGLLFMGLPQALVDVAMGNATGKEASKAIGKLLLNSAPGVVPAAPKPILEAFYGQTAFGPIESEREKRLEASERFRPGTTEVAKTLGSFTGMVGISPLMIEHFVRGYTGGLGVALMSTLNPLLRSEAEGEKMPVGASRQPFIGGLFQPAEGRFLIDRAYDRMEEVTQAQQTYKDLVNRGQRDRASAYAKENAALIAGAPLAGAFRQRMGELFDMERKVMANPKLSGEEKEAKVQQLKDIQNRLAKQFYAASERTTPR